MIRYLLLCLGLVIATTATGHKPSDSYLSLQQAQHLKGRLDIALRDLEQAIGLDMNGDRAITWAELQARRPEVLRYVDARLQLHDAGGAACELTPRDYLVADHSDGRYAVLLFTSDCAAPVTLVYDLLFDVDPLHRGLLSVSGPSGMHTAILSPEHPSYQLVTAPSLLRTVRDFVWQGVWHVLIGFDHVLFVALLVLSCVPPSPWPGNTRAVTVDVVKLVTAFTVAHSITLSLATLGYIDLPSRWVEVGIAASVVLAAVNNFVPVLGTRRWLIAFGFGLVHGLGFASVLADLGLPVEALVGALLAFNIGVELGQLSIIALLLPVLLWVRHAAVYRRVAVPAGSAAAAAVGTVWFFQRLLA